MTAPELYKLEDFDLFIAQVEENWLTFSSEEDRVKMFFGDANKGLELFKKWQNDELDLSRELLQK